ncbi:MAG: hypothetical protein WDZ76_10075 [Pseudohongiellaceae bacterium]
MVRIRSVMPGLFLFGFQVVTPGLAQVSPGPDFLQQMESHRELLAQIEMEQGRDSPALVDPMQGLAALATNLNQFDEADALLSRAIQIVRINDGLYTENQFPLIVERIDNDRRRGRWDEVNDNLEHLKWLYHNKHEGIDSEIVNELMYVHQIHMAGVAEDSEDRQPYHFREAANANWVALAASGLVWGENDPRRARIMYELVKLYYLQTIAIDRGGRTGYELREIVPGSSWVRSRRLVKRAFYATGLNLLRQMRDMFRHASPLNREAIAMSDLYLADWHLLFTHTDRAKGAYARAYQGLEDAAVDDTLLARYFEAPAVVPKQQFFATLAEAYDDRLQAAERLPRATLYDTRSLVRFTEWSRNFPRVQHPLSADVVAAADPGSGESGYAMLSFSTGALVEVNQWINGRLRTRLGVVDRFEVLRQYPEELVDEEGLAEKIQALHFRPRLVDGVATASTGTLQYLFP